jgi:hypothetical protein
METMSINLFQVTVALSPSETARTYQVRVRTRREAVRTALAAYAAKYGSGEAVWVEVVEGQKTTHSDYHMV